VVNISDYDPTRATLPYGLDRELASVLPILWYCLHLPRTRFDFVDTPAKAMKAFQNFDFPHHLVLLPVPWPEPLPELLSLDSPTIIRRTIGLSPARCR
jgi:hypothetical protein